MGMKQQQECSSTAVLPWSVTLPMTTGNFWASAAVWVHRELTGSSSQLLSCVSHNHRLNQSLIKRPDTTNVPSTLTQVPPYGFCILKWDDVCIDEHSVSKCVNGYLFLLLWSLTFWWRCSRSLQKEPQEKYRVDLSWPHEVIQILQYNAHELDIDQY